MCITFFCIDPFSSTTISNLNNKAQDQHKRKDQATKSSKGRKNKRIKKEKVLAKDKEKNKQDQLSESDQQEKHISNIKFLIAFNRDEQSQRRTLKLGPFDDDPNIYAGRDIKSTGTWLGVNIKTGIMVVLTNYDLPAFRPGKSRGQLVKSFLKTDFISEQNIKDDHETNKKIEHNLKQILAQCADKKYAAFNLLVFNIRTDSLYYICSQLNMKNPDLLKSSQVYGLCNTDLGTIWPKTKHGVELFTNVISTSARKNDDEIFDELSKMMRDTKQFSKNPNDEASIFIQPFFSTLENAQRMTKSTFIAMIKETSVGQDSNKPKQLELVMRQITYKNIAQPQGLSKKDQNYKKHSEYDHAEEIIIEHRLKF